jgi:hypothetical protein
MVNVVEWDIADMVEVYFPEPEDFLKIRETLTRIGIPSIRDEKQTLFQSCHILHKKGKYYIVHFKELFCLDGKKSTLAEDDLARRNTIINLLCEWDLIDVVHKDKIENKCPLSQMKIISFKDKDNWDLVPKYSIGKRI